MKAIILARVSTEEQKEAGNSLPAQVSRLENYCKQKKFQIIKTYSFDESAYKTKRDGFDKILDYLKSNKEKIADESYYLAVNQVLSLSQRASEIFESSEPNEKRQLLNYLLQNCRLNERSLFFELKKPFDALVKYNKCPEMLRIVNNVRTIIQRQTGYVYIPDLRPKQ